MRLATFNVENMFQRVKAMNLDSWADGKAVLEDFARLNTLVQEAVYTDPIKAELLAIMKRNKGLLSRGLSKYIRLRDVRGRLLLRREGKAVEVQAGGRGDWLGWFELEREAVKEAATLNVARVVGLVNADVQCVVEAEDRGGLVRFNTDVLPLVQAPRFGHVMLIDGNDDRGIDVGIMTRSAFPIVRMRSHVDDADAKGKIFSRDCVEYELKTAAGNDLLVLVNHFKSKGFGSAASSAAKRLRQATRVRQIYEERLQQGVEHIAIAGDFNETPDAAPMAPLTGAGSTLTDIMAHPKFVGDGRPGTFGSGTQSAKLDYILLSPKLAAKVSGGGIERRGVWAGATGTLFPHLPSLKSAKDAASDHAALWVDLDL